MTRVHQLRRDTLLTTSEDSFTTRCEARPPDSTANCPPPTSSRTTNWSLTELLVCSEDDVRRVIMSSLTKSCTLDPIPTFILKEATDVLLPFLTAMLNASLREGCLPASQKRAIITPLLK